MIGNNFTLENPYPNHLKIEFGSSDIIHGILYRPSIENLGLSDSDDYVKSRRKLLNVTPGVQTSKENLDILKQSIQENDKIFMEIGINGIHKYNTFTSILINKAIERKGKYIGIDIGDRSIIPGWYDNNPSISINQISSTDFNGVSDIIKENGGILDLLLIDGDHSVNMVLNDWKYTQFVKKGGMIVMHDTNVHPGSRIILDAIDQSLYEVKRYCINDHDFGIATAKKL